MGILLRSSSLIPDHLHLLEPGGGQELAELRRIDGFNSSRQ
jgi:hypothetical protein